MRARWGLQALQDFKDLKVLLDSPSLERTESRETWGFQVLKVLQGLRVL